jgi:MSHA biogenesis protein MshE
MTGHLVLSTLHTNDALSTPIRLLDMGVPRYMVALSLHLVLAQRLVRTVCPHCAEPHQPEAREIALVEGLGLSLEGARFMRGRGCVHCNDTGYAGRTGVYEFLEMDGDLVTHAKVLADADVASGRRDIPGFDVIEEKTVV